MPNTYLSPKQIYKQYGIETNKIYWWVRQKKIVHLKIGKTVLIPKSEFEIFLDNNTLKPIDEDDYVIPEEIL